MEAELRAQIPKLDSVVSTYASGFLKFAASSHAAEEASSEDAVSQVTQLLLSSSGDFSSENEAAIHNLVEKLLTGLTAANGVDPEARQRPAARRLDQALHVGSQRNVSSTLMLAGGNVDLESANSKRVESRVDRKKLEKAERKIRAKQERKQFRDVEYEASRLINQPDETQTYEEFFMAVNPLQLGSDSASKSKDIKVDGIDVSIGGKRILSDTNLTLAYSRRYGLVGMNGIGKSTLLRALSRREVAIPTHISILHVEQEVRPVISTSKGSILIYS